MRRFPIVVAIATGIAAFAGSAWAGGWASAGLTLPPATIEAGQEWEAEITILQHGKTPTDGAEPSVIIRDGASGRSETFRAVPSGEVGHYTASVVFPTSGSWAIEVDNGFAATGYGISDTTTFGTVDVQAPEAVVGAGESRFPVVLLIVGTLGALGLAVAGAAGVRRLRKVAASH